MEEKTLECRLDNFLEIESLDGWEHKTSQVFFEENKLSLRSLQATKGVDFSDLFLTSNLALENVECIEFINCVFKKDIYINIGIESHVNSIIIKGCSFEGRLYINEQSEENSSNILLDQFSIVDTECKGNFKLHNSVIKLFFARDTDFISNADFFKSRLIAGGRATYELKTDSTDSGIIQFKSINFEGLALFGEVYFESLVSFRYVTFKGYVHFKDSKFKKGVDLDYANIEKDINFYNIKGLTSNISQNNTSQETYRIIKYQLKKVGNTIDSNKFHSFELKKKKLSLCKCSLDYIVLSLHGITSEYSQNWLRPLIFIFIVGIITMLSIKYFNGALNKGISFSELFKYISIINIGKNFEESPIIFILNKISLGYLYYQFITSIRKDTKI